MGRMIDVTLREIDEKYYSEISMLFAGGIHDEVSAAFIAGLTSKPRRRDVKLESDECNVPIHRRIR